jgi:hypothetical protein
MFLVKNTNGILVNVHGADSASGVRIYRGGQFAGKPVVAYAKVYVLPRGCARSRSRLSLRTGSSPKSPISPVASAKCAVQTLRTLCVHFAHAFRTRGKKFARREIYENS